MNANYTIAGICFRTACLVCGTLCLNAALFAQTPENKSDNTDEAVSSVESPAAAEGKCVSIEVARDRAKLMHDIYVATLDVMHDRYFHADRSIVPARAMEDVFAEMQRTSHVQARWIAVNLKPMSVDHEAQSEFEKRAARQISAGQLEIETVEDGFYRRAGPIPLGSDCVSCHAGFFRTPSTKPKFAGLVISVPIHTDSAVGKKASGFSE